MIRFCSMVVAVVLTMGFQALDVSAQGLGSRVATNRQAVRELRADANAARQADVALLRNTAPAQQFSTGCQGFRHSAPVAAFTLPPQAVILASQPVAGFTAPAAFASPSAFLIQPQAFTAPPLAFTAPPAPSAFFIAPQAFAAPQAFTAPPVAPLFLLGH